MDHLQSMELHTSAPVLHRADEILLNTPIEHIDMDIIKADKTRLLRVVQLANLLHDKAADAACMVGGDVEIPQAVVDPRIIGGEAASRQGGLRAARGLMRIAMEGRSAIGPQHAPSDATAITAPNVSPRTSTAILTV